jgi:hypothetical protein
MLGAARTRSTFHAGQLISGEIAFSCNRQPIQQRTPAPRIRVIAGGDELWHRGAAVDRPRRRPDAGWTLPLACRLVRRATQYLTVG